VVFHQPQLEKYDIVKMGKNLPQNFLEKFSNNMDETTTYSHPIPKDPGMS